MKKLTKILALVLVLALALSLTACAGKATIVGTWKYNMDMAKVMEASGAMEGMSGESSGMTEEQTKALMDTFKKIFDGVNMSMVLDLKEDNSYTMSVDEASAKAAGETLAKRVPELMPELLAAMFGGEEGVSQFMEMTGMTMEQMSASFAEEFNAEEMLEGMSTEPQKGTYTYEEGKLVLTSEDNDAVTMTVELGSKELKVTAIDSKDAGDDQLKMFEAILPMVFTR